MDLKKKEGFAGQVSVVLPESIRKTVQDNSLINELYLTDIGYYPKARYHFRERLHGANEEILIYVVDGRGEVIIDGNRHQLKQNQFILIPSGSPHRYISSESDPWSIYWLHFTGEKNRHLKLEKSKVVTISTSKTSRIKDRINLFNEIIEVLSLGFSPDNLEYSNQCLIYLLASFRYIEQYRKVNYAGEKDFVKKTILFMQQNLEKSLTLKALADQQSLSVSHFSRMFKQKTQSSPMDYFIQLKMQSACQMLNYSNFKVYEIATKLGYEDEYYFSRIFKKVMGVSPLAYKKINNG